MENQAITRRQRRATAAERLQMVEQFRRSGMTRAVFSRQYQIPLATLNWWLAKSRREATLPVPRPLLFSEIRLPPLPTASLGGWAMELVSPSGLTVRFREALPAREVARLLRGAQC